jgi:L-threonylcarbamoyladenylate synthase
MLKTTRTRPANALSALEAHLAEAVEALRRGCLVAFPTETVYGLGADARNEAAVREIFRVKGRPADHPLIVHLPSAAHLSAWAVAVPELAYALAERFWPGPLTLVLQRHPSVLDAVTGAQVTVGVRVPGHPVALKLLRAFGGGVAAPSANRFGRISPTTAEHVRAELGEAALVLDGGPCAVGLESTILDVSRVGDAGGLPRLLRPGGIPLAALQEVVRAVAGLEVENAVQAPASSARPAVPLPRVSGSLESHYAPATPALLVEDAAAYLAQRLADGFADEVAVLARRPQPLLGAAAKGVLRLWRTLPDTATDYGRLLYAALRELDALGCALLLIEAPPAAPEWAAVADRLRRATAPAAPP